MVSPFHLSETNRLKHVIRRIVWRLFLCGILACWLGGAVHQAAAQSPPIPPPVIPDGPAAETVLEALWRNSLYSIANDACRAQVAVLPTNSDECIRWQCWLIRGLASEALDVEDRSPPDLKKVAENWEQIEAIHQEITNVSPPPLRGLWIRWQYLHATHLRAQGAMARYLANPLDNESREKALQSIRDLDRGGELLQKSIAEMVVSTSTSTTAQARKQIRELQELSTETALLRCEALALRGQAYPLQSADAIAAGTEMERSAIEAAGKVAADWSGRSKLDLAITVSKWLQGNRAETLERAQTLLQSNDSRVRLRALDLLVQTALQGDDRALAEKTLQEFQSLDATPEFAMAQLRLALFDLPKDSNGGSQKQQAMTQLLEARDAIGKRFGGYWQRRAEALLLSVTSSKTTPDMRNSNEATELVRIEVRQLLAANRVDEAIGKLLQQAALLKRDQVHDIALQFTLQAAAIKQKTKNWEGAGDLFRQAAIDFPAEKDASAAHLMAIFCVTQAVRNTPNNQEIWSKLDELFVEQLKIFPEDPASFQAALQFAQSANLRRIWLTAADKLRPHIEHVLFANELAWLIVELEMRGIYWQYPENDPRVLEQAKKHIAAWSDWAAALSPEAANNPLRNLSATIQIVMRDLSPESVALQLDDDPNLNKVRTEWSKTILQSDEAGYSWKLAWETVNQAKKEMDTNHVLTAKTITPLAALLQPPNNAASEESAADNTEMKGLAPSVSLFCASGVLLEQIEWLSPPDRFSSREAMEEISNLLAKASVQPTWKSLPPDHLDLLQWRFNPFGLNRQQYMGQIEQRIKSQPRVAVWQRAKAALLETGDSDELEQALGIYRKLAAGSKNGSDDWLRARYRSALCLVWLKKFDDAKQAVEVILLTHSPKGTVWKNRLDNVKNMK